MLVPCSEQSPDCFTHIDNSLWLRKAVGRVTHWGLFILALTLVWALSRYEYTSLHSLCLCQTAHDGTGFAHSSQGIYSYMDFLDGFLKYISSSVFFFFFFWLKQVNTRGIKHFTDNEHCDHQTVVSNSSMVKHVNIIEINQKYKPTWA